MLRRVPLALLLLTAGAAWAQSVISAHSGVINYTEGNVLLDGQAVRLETSKVTDVKSGQTLAAEDGRSEVLLTPGVFLRLAENSSFKMVSNKLADTRVEIESGSAIVEVGELLQDNVITVLFHDVQIELLKKGLYRIDADSGRLRVYDGEARVTSGSNTPTVAKKGREVLLGTVLEAHNFDTKQTDDFYRWSARRDQYVAQANVSAARSVGNYGSGYTGFGNYGSGYGSGGLGSWAWNPWFGMFTFIPYNNMYYSPFGYAYYSPRNVYYLYQPSSGYFGNSGSGRAAATSYASSTPAYNGSVANTVAPRASMPGPASIGGGGGSRGMSGGGMSAGAGAGAGAGGGSRGSSSSSSGGGSRGH